MCEFNKFFKAILCNYIWVMGSKDFFIILLLGLHIAIDIES